MALVGAVNPDFGQVEVDPAVVNLTAFETFFEEKRPFFTEGSQVFLRFGRSGASDYTTYFYPEPQLFYSRRIGRAPQGSGERATSSTPRTATTILGAAKLVGRTKSGWNVGLLEAVTGREYARVGDGRSPRPRRGRAAHELLRRPRAARARAARASIGFLGTAVVRDLGHRRLDGLLVDRAFVGGVDGHVFLDGRRDWVVSGGLAGSTRRRQPGRRCCGCSGPRQRYYQRPDAPHVSVDPTATSLSGWSGRLGLNKNSGNVTFNAGLWGISPGFEPNDLGFATQTDRGGAHGQVALPEADAGRVDPHPPARGREVVDLQLRPRVPGRRRAWLSAGAQLRNYWQLDLTLGKSWNTWDDKLTRGGPTTIRPGIESLTLVATSDARRRFWVSAQAAALEPRVRQPQPRSTSPPSTCGPGPRSRSRRRPRYLRAHTIAQYLSTVARRDRHRDLRQPLRLRQPRPDRVVDPAAREPRPLAEALAAALHRRPCSRPGTIPTIRELAAPRTYDFPVYGVDVGTIATRTRTARPSTRSTPTARAPAASFRIPVPDFNFKSLRVNAVLRWEFRPGSAAYVVWTQRRQDGRNPGDHAFGRDLGDLFARPGRRRLHGQARLVARALSRPTASERANYNRPVEARGSWPVRRYRLGRRARRRPQPLDHRRGAARHDAGPRRRGLGSHRCAASEV